MSTTDTSIRGHFAEVIASEHHGPGDDGLSARTRRVVIVGAGGTDPVTDDAPAVRLITRVHVAACGGATLQHFAPVAPVSPGRAGYMASGAYVVVPLAAARTLGMVPAAYALHDRSEARPDYLAND
ncbi:hypothetical protein [Plantibacter sp. CFBP 8804]|uniref:hypothetical protein n=1 Tax=Plantibacter sp. CFBP 8804 TaxID=2775270 RepID=UPI0017811BEE|nr:hypothetical protein [Plantibacter sp. CFBP 8804]MBD8519179.1 hypothetical protein [Plantibacter sp. CFBP 8804]